MIKVLVNHFIGPKSPNCQQNHILTEDMCAPYVNRYTTDWNNNSMGPLKHVRDNGMDGILPIQVTRKIELT